MLIKLAALSSEEEAKVRENLNKPQVRGSSVLLGNLAHPAVLGGGIIGNTMAGVASDKLFHGNALNDLYRTREINTGKKVLGIFQRKKTVLQHITPSASFIESLGKNALRGVGGAVGAGLGAMFVMNARKKKKE